MGASEGGVAESVAGDWLVLGCVSGSSAFVVCISRFSSCPCLISCNLQSMHSQDERWTSASVAAVKQSTRCAVQSAGTVQARAPALHEFGACREWGLIKVLPRSVHCVRLGVICAGRVFRRQPGRREPEWRHHLTSASITAFLSRKRSATARKTLPRDIPASFAEQL